MTSRIREFFKRETVLCVSAVCAVLTMFLVPPDGAYIGYIDLRVLCLLLCLMAVVAGFQSCGAFQWLAVQMLRRGGGGRGLSVALVLQTIAANLGSMATPVGNPQNLYLYAAYHLSMGEFFAAMLPLTLVSLLCLVAAALPVLPRELPAPDLGTESLKSPKKLAVYGVLFLLCLLTVFRILPYGVMTVIVLIALAVMEPKLLRGLDIALLATFVCFFIVSGNLGRVEAVRTLLQSVLDRSTLGTAVLTSQVISNVPAAVLLSGFTDQWRPLLEGVNIGGLGTPIASLASLITLKLYLRSREARPGRFLLVFTAANLIGLVILLAVAIFF